MSIVTLTDVERARARVAGRVRTSPTAFSRTLSDATGTTLSFKLENLQMTGSFKERGACNRLLSLTPDQRAGGVIAASAGNHAQGVAYHAREMGIAATIVMPRTTPLVKVTQTRGYGAAVILHGGGYDEAYDEARKLAAERGLLLVHGFDDPDIVAGQGTVGLELLEQVPDVDAVIVPVGGGGLIAGIATVIKERKPHVGVYGVQTDAMPSTCAALHEGKPVRIEPRRTIAEGIAVARVGALPFESIKRYVDDVVTVDDEEIAEAILTLVEQEKTVAEGAAAAGLAALFHRTLPVAGKNVVVVLSGGNIDVNVLSRIIDRGLAKSGRIARLRVAVPDVPGSLARILSVVAEREANILQVDHDRSPARLEFGQASVDLVAETRGFDHITQIVEAIRGCGFEVTL